MRPSELLHLIFDCPRARQVEKCILVIPCVDLDMLETQRLTLGLIDVKALPEDQAEAITGVLSLLNYWADIRDDLCGPRQIAAHLALTVLAGLARDDSVNNELYDQTVKDFENIAKGAKK